jgi:ribonucleotide monophosphatase NagD (HAD superfamily)
MTTSVPPQAVLLDLEGTLYAKGEAIADAAGAVAELRSLGLGLRFLTNTDSKTTGQILGDLAGYGLGVPVEVCVVVGDDATTDIAGGRDAGLRTVQVRTGKYSDQRAEGLTGGADHTIDSVTDLPALLRALRAA